MTPLVLTVGYEPQLLATRSMVLRHAGYFVKEATVLARALREIETDHIDILVVCNTIPFSEKSWFANEVLNRRRLLPVICIKTHAYEQKVPGCVAVENDPDSLLQALKLVTP